MIKTIIFDIDGTLVDTEETVIKSLQAALKEAFNLNLSSKDLEFSLGITGEDALKQLGVDVKMGMSTWHRTMNDYRDASKLFPGIRKTLEQLQSDYQLAIVTSKTRFELHEDVADFNILHFFAEIITASDTSRHKPSPEPILEALTRLNAKSTESIYIGDTAYDQQSAMAAGVKFGLANWGAHDHGQFTQADFKFKNPVQLLTAFK